MRVCRRWCLLLAALLGLCSLAVLCAGADAAGAFDIELYAENELRYFYEWAHAFPDPALIVVEYSIGNQENWVSDSEEFHNETGAVFRFGYYTEKILIIDKSKLEPEVDTYVRVRYEDQASNILHIFMPQELPELYELEASQPTFEVTVLPTGSDLSLLELPDAVPCQYNRFLSVFCEVEWEDVSAINVSKPGWITIRGEITPPEGFTKPPELAAHYPVMLTAPGMAQEPVEVSGDSYLLMVVAVGTDPSTLPGGSTVFGKRLPDTLSYLTANGLMGEFSITWDFSEVDTSKAGRYPVRYTSDLPICFSVPQLSATVVVMEPDRIDLSGYATNSQLFVVCHWLYEVSDYQNILLQYSVDGGPWQNTQGVDVDGMVVHGDIVGKYGAKGLAINFINLTYSEISIRLLYRESISTVLRITLLEEGYTLLSVEGDRGGADQGEQKPPDIGQPAPDREAWKPRPAAPRDALPPELAGEGSAPAGDAAEQGSAPMEEHDHTLYLILEAEPRILSVPFEEPTLQNPTKSSGASKQPDVRELAGDDVPGAQAEGGMMEVVTETSLSISGVRLEEMLALSGDTVLFEKQGVSVELPADFLRGLEIASNARFTVRVSRGDNSFSLELLRDELPLTALPPTVVYIPFTKADGVDTERLACFDELGQQVSTAVYDAALQVARAEIHATGSYTVAPRAASTVAGGDPDGGTQGGNEPQAGITKNGWALACAAGLAATVPLAGWGFVRRRRIAGETRDNG